MNTHAMTPQKVLHLVRQFGGTCERILLVGCEPATLGDEELGAMGLSEVVQDAVERSVPIVASLVADALSGRQALTN